MSDEGRTVLVVAVVTTLLASLGVGVTLAVEPVYKSLGETAVIVLLVAALVAVYFIYTKVISIVYRRRR